MPRSTEKKPAAPKKKATKPATKAERATHLLFIGRSMHCLGVGVEGQGVVPCAAIDPGTQLMVTYFDGPSGLSSALTSVKMHLRINGVDQTPVALTGKAKHRGEVVRIPATVEIPADARDVEYWFELETAAGETIWDSNYGNNFRMSVTSKPAGNGEAAAAPQEAHQGQ